MQFYKSFSKQYLIILVLTILEINAFEVSGQIRNNNYSLYRFDSTELADRKINVIKTNVISYIIHDFNITYERLNRHASRSFVAKVDYLTFTSDNFSISGTILRGGPRYYLIKKRLPPAGCYVEPFLIYSEYKFHDNKYNTGSRASEVGFGLIGGWQWAIGKRFTIEVFLGGQYGNVTNSNINTRGIIKAFIPVLGASTGFRF